MMMMNKVARKRSRRNRL